jgi:thiamine biosynthesis lipoprotein
MTVLRDLGIQHAVVDAGADMKVFGRKFGEPWEIAIKHPRDRDRAMAVLRLSNSSVVTSGDYERFFELDGKRYHHIIYPRTGYPSTGCLSASVVAGNAEYGDALATAMCVLGPEKGLEFIESLKRVEAILVGLDGEVHVSTGLRGMVK